MTIACLADVHFEMETGTIGIAFAGMSGGEHGDRRRGRWPGHPSILGLLNGRLFPEIDGWSAGDPGVDWDWTGVPIVVNLEIHV